MLAAVAAVTVAGGLAVASPALADADDVIRINEVQSTSETDAPDFVELINAGSAEADISGLVLRDSEDDHEFVVPEGTTIAPGAFFVIEPDAGADGFGLGKADSARLFDTDGTTLLDSFSWEGHASTRGRVPDGTGGFVETEPTPNAANVARAAVPSVVINEIESNGDTRGDWVELANADTTNSADVTGWTLIDGDDTHEPIVLDGEIESGGYLGVLTEPSFGLGGGDTVTVRDADGELVDTVTWEAHSATTLARCPDMTGDVADSAAGTFESANDCATTEQPTIEVEPWPYGNTVNDGVAVDTWGDDMSGLDIASDGTVYAVNNDAGEISRLADGPDTYTVDEAWQPTYPDGTGTPDGEGIAVDDEGAVYLATERNNDASSVSRPSVLRYELGAGGAVTATDEWNLSELTGPIGANGGAEAVEWISDTDAVAAGLDYDPAAFGDHLGGIFAVGIEQTGVIHIVVLEEDGGITQLQAIEPSEAVAGVMGLDWRNGGNQLFAQCDEVCDNRSAEFEIAGGEFVRIAEYAAPTGMDPSYTNEGVAMSWCNAEPDTIPTVLWMSDSAHEGVSLRIAPGECSEPGETDADADGADADGATDADGSTDADADGSTDADADGSTDGETDGDTEQDEATVSVPATATRGETIDVTVTGADVAEVAVWLHSEPQLLAEGALSDDGTIEVTIPADAELGDHTIVVETADGERIGSAPIELVSAAAADGELAVTGSQLSLALPILAAGLIIAGGAALAARRRTRA